MTRKEFKDRIIEHDVRFLSHWVVAILIGLYFLTNTLSSSKFFGEQGAYTFEVGCTFLASLAITGIMHSRWKKRAIAAGLKCPKCDKLYTFLEDINKLLETGKCTKCQAEFFDADEGEVNPYAALND